MMRFRVQLPAVIALAVCLAAPSPADAQWRRIDSPNFVVIGEAGATDLRDIAVKFEAFRETLSRLLTERAIATAVPTVVVVFRHDRAFTPFKPRFEGKPVEVGGMFVPRHDINYILIVGDGEPWRLPIVFHEFAHLIIANAGRNVPVWLSEGLAEYYSTFEVIGDGREVRLGLVLEDRLAHLNETPMLPLETLLSVDHGSPLYNEGNRRSTFYAQAWALTHLILRGKPDRTGQLAAYLDNLSNGMPAKQAWDQAFGSEDMARELDGYIRRQAFMTVRHRFPEKLGKVDGRAVPVRPVEVQALLAELLIHQDRIDEADEILTNASKLEPGNARFGIAASSLDLARRDRTAAEKRLRELGAPADWLSNYLAGIAVADLADYGGDLPDPHWIETARRYFSAARTSGHELPNALARMAELDLRSREGPSPATREAIERARALAPGRHDYAITHAQVLARQSEFAAARAVLGPYLSNQYPSDIRSAARDLLARVAEVEISRMTRSGGLPPKSAPSAAGNAPEFPTPSTGRPVFRDLQPGEQRAEGVLAGIECPNGRPVFQLKTTAGVTRYSAGQLAAVDLISYRPDLTGTIDCGPFKEPMAVYLTWRLAADGSGARIAIAIEFLPRQP
jgi:uncharacterized protein DUF1570